MRAKLVRRRLELRCPFRIAHGSYSYRESLFLWLEDSGCAAMGEAPVVPYYGVSADEVERDLRSGLSPRLVREALAGRDGADGAFAHAASRSAFRTAALSLRSSVEARAPRELLGLASGRTPPSSYTVAFGEGEAMVEIAAASGFRRLKVKAGIPGDVERVRLIRERLPGALVRVDANQGWSFEEAPSKLAALEELGVELVEEPIAGTSEQLQALASSTALPILLDESVRAPEDVARYAREAPSVAGIVVKIAKNGGPQASLGMARAAREAGKRVMLSCMVESSLGAASALCLAPLCAWLDLDSPLLIANDPFTGLLYEGEAPIVAPGGVVPGPALAAQIELAESLFEEA